MKKLRILHTDCMCFIRFLELTAIFSLHIIKWFVFVVETLSVFHEIQAQYLNISYLKFLLRSVKFKTWFYDSEGSVVNGAIQLATAGVAALTVTTVAFIWSILYLAQIPTPEHKFACFHVSTTVDKKQIFTKVFSRF